MKDINIIFSELAQYKRLQEETAAIIDGLQDEIKEYMLNNNTDEITGSEHKATYKTVVSSRIDTTALKKELPKIAEIFTKTTETKRFLFK